MGEKDNLLDVGEEIYANLAEQGPQLWPECEQYKLSLDQSAQARVVAEQQAAGQDAPANRSAPRRLIRRAGPVPGRSYRRLREALRLHVPSDVTPGPSGLPGLEFDHGAGHVR